MGDFSIQFAYQSTSVMYDFMHQLFPVKDINVFFACFIEATLALVILFTAKKLH